MLEENCYEFQNCVDSLQMHDELMQAYKTNADVNEIYKKYAKAVDCSNEYFDALLTGEKHRNGDKDY